MQYLRKNTTASVEDLDRWDAELVSTFHYYYADSGSKLAEFYAEYQICGNDWKKVHPAKVICQKLLKLAVVV